MEKTKFEKMEELDAKIEKINYDLLGLESRKKEIEEKKFAKQQEIEKQEEEKRDILAKTDKMNKIQKFIYVVFALKNDLKQVELLNAKIDENRKEKDSIQNKIDIQNNLYAETIREKEKCIDQRRELYVEKSSISQEESKKEKTEVLNHPQDLAKIHQIAKQYKNSKIMSKVAQMIENEINKYLKDKEDTKIITNKKVAEEQEEME